MSLASFSLPDLQIRGKCCNFTRCGDCFNPGDRIIMQPPPQGSNEPTINVSTTKCCLFCIRDDGSVDENRLTWQVFHHYLELAYGKQAAEFALSSKRIDTRDALHLSTPLRAQDYQELKEIAEHAFSRHADVEEVFKWVKLKAAFESLSPAELKEITSFEGKWERIGSIHVEGIKPTSKPEPFDVDKIKNNLRQAPVDKKLAEADIERITLLVLDDILMAGRDVLKRDEIQAKMLRYLKALGFTIRSPEYYERIAPLALRTLHKTDVNSLSSDEYAAYLQLASTLIMKRPTMSSAGDAESLRSGVGFPVTISSAKDSQIIGHIQFIGPAPALEELKSTLRKDHGIEVDSSTQKPNQMGPIRGIGDDSKEASPRGTNVVRETSV